MAITEIVRNACEASPAHGVVKIEVRAEAHKPASGTSNAVPPITWIELTVTDSGSGIKPELAEKIFNPFFSTKQKKDASGLGLTVALGLVQQLGGAIRYKSKAGRTTFRLLLPSRSERG